MADASAFLETNVFNGGSFGPYVRFELNKTAKVHAILGDGEGPLRVFIHRVLYPRFTTDPETGEAKETQGYAESVCIGKLQGCMLCAKNIAAEEELGKSLPNTDKPFPLTPRWLMNVWNFETKRVEVLKGGKALFDQIAKIFEVNGSLDSVDLVVGKSGTGGRNDTNYSAVNTPAEPINVPKEKMAPFDVVKLANDLILGAEELQTMLSGKVDEFPPSDDSEDGPKALPSGSGPPIQTIGGNQASPPQQPSEPSMTVEQAKGFKLTTGKYKGKLLGAVVDIDTEYLKFAVQSRSKKLVQAATVLMGNTGGTPQAPAPAQSSAASGGDEKQKLTGEINGSLEKNEKYRNFSLIVQLFREVTKTAESPKGKVDLVDFTVEELKAVLAKLQAEAKA